MSLQANLLGLQQTILLVCLAANQQVSQVVNRQHCHLFLLLVFHLKTHLGSHQVNHLIDQQLSQVVNQVLCHRTSRLGNLLVFHHLNQVVTHLYSRPDLLLVFHLINLRGYHLNVLLDSLLHFHPDNLRYSLQWNRPVSQHLFRLLPRVGNHLVTHPQHLQRCHRLSRPPYHRVFQRHFLQASQVFFPVLNPRDSLRKYRLESHLVVRVLYPLHSLLAPRLVNLPATHQEIPPRNQAVVPVVLQQNSLLGLPLASQLSDLQVSHLESLL